MNKPELIAMLSQKTGLSKQEAEKALDGLTNLIIEELKRGNEVTVTGFGTFSARHRSARKGVNPQNPKEIIDMPAVTVPKFKAGKTLKDALKAK
jgi:DNA-binding protein HU-beta